MQHKFNDHSSKLLTCFQMVLYDTPGVIERKMHKLDSLMMKNVHSAAINADCVLVVVDACKEPQKVCFRNLFSDRYIYVTTNRTLPGECFYMVKIKVSVSKIHPQLFCYFCTISCVHIFFFVFLLLSPD